MNSRPRTLSPNRARDYTNAVYAIEKRNKKGANVRDVADQLGIVPGGNVTHALQHLVQDGVLAFDGKRYRIRPASPDQHVITPSPKRTPAKVPHKTALRWIYDYIQANECAPSCIEIGEALTDSNWPEAAGSRILVTLTREKLIRHPSGYKRNISLTEKGLRRIGITTQPQEQAVAGAKTTVATLPTYEPEPRVREVVREIIREVPAPKPRGFWARLAFLFGREA